MKSLEVNIEGPYGWPKFECDLPRLPTIPGVYLLTFEHRDGFLPYGVGISRRPMRARFGEHTRSYRTGNYNILDVDVGQQGSREVVWKGWGWTSDKRADFDARRSEIVSLAERQLLATRIFVMDFGAIPRGLERMEAAIGNHYYKNDDTLFDRGMFLAPRWKTEEPVLVTFRCGSLLFELPPRLST